MRAERAALERDGYTRIRSPREKIREDRFDDRFTAVPRDRRFFDGHYDDSSW